MGACETTPATRCTPREPASDPRTPSTHGKGCSSPPIISRRLPASSSFVLARACRRGAAGAPALTPARAAAHTGSSEEKPQLQSHPPTRRPRPGHRVNSARTLDSGGPHGCDNDSIHHARKVTAYLDEHPRIEVMYGARYSPHDNPVERIWGALKNYVANTAVTWPGRLRQIHSFFRTRSPDEMLATAAPWTSPWLPPGYEQNI
jgi:DDE superfamily endonuclease